jgi:hypothetical protein
MTRHIYAMRRTTVFLDDQTLHRAQAYADRQGVSFASVVREAVAAYIADPQRPSTVPSIAGRFASDRTDVASNVDHYLWTNPHE